MTNTTAKVMAIREFLPRNVRIDDEIRPRADVTVPSPASRRTRPPSNQHNDRSPGRSKLTTPLIFVPTIGFRPRETRTQRERAETSTSGTKLIVSAVAAAPDRTDVVIEWERTGDPADCPPDSRLLVYSNMAPLEHGVAVTLVAGRHRLGAITMRRRAYQASYYSIGAIDALTFPALPADADTAE